MVVELTDKAIKDLSKINRQDALKIFSKIESLKDFPQVANLKKLNNFMHLLKVAKIGVCFKKKQMLGAGL